MLIQVQVDAESLQVFDRLEQITERAPHAVDSPGHHDVEFAPVRVLEHPIKAGLCGVFPIAGKAPEIGRGGPKKILSEFSARGRRKHDAVRRARAVA